VRWHAARSGIVDQLFTISGSYGSDTFKNRAVPVVLDQLIGLLRAQVGVECASTAAGQPCAWATQTIPQNLADIISGPLAAGLVDLLDIVRQDESARVELGKFASYLLDWVNGAHTVSVMGLVDVLSLLHDHTTVSAALRMASDAARPPVRDASGRILSRGALDAGVIALHRIFNRADATASCDGTIDPHGTIPLLLRNLMAPMTVDGRTPLEAFADAIGDVNRVDPTSSEAYDPADFAKMAHELGDLMLNKERGLEQVYAVIKQATR
jgi:hypothetical protein